MRVYRASGCQRAFTGRVRVQPRTAARPIAEPPEAQKLIGGRARSRLGSEWKWLDSCKIRGFKRPMAKRKVCSNGLGSDACKTLGLRDVVGSFTADELKRAYRTAVRMAHPDAPGGSAQKLQKVKDAYDFLAAAPDVKVWDEGRRSYGAGGVGSTPQPKKPKPDSMRREVILGGIGGATLLSIAIASQVVSTDKRDVARCLHLLVEFT